MTSFRLLAAALLVVAAAPVQGQIYKCEGSDGVVEYSNSPASAQSGRNCKPIELSPITTIPAPKLPARAASPAGKPAADAAAPKAGAATASARAASPEGFPKVDSATQRARDSDRKRILEEELGKEETRLAELRKEYNNGEPERLGSERNYQKYLDRVQRLKEDIARSEANLVVIRRELETIRN